MKMRAFRHVWVCGWVCGWDGGGWGVGGCVGGVGEGGVWVGVWVGWGRYQHVSVDCTSANATFTQATHLCQLS